MICNGYDKVFDLENGELIEMTDARGTTLRVTKGTLWVTQERDRNDIVLRAGDVWTVERAGLTVAEAQGVARICVVGPAAATTRSRTERRAAARPWFRRLSDFLRPLGDALLRRRFVPYV